jgi:hypothetical protein
MKFIKSYEMQNLMHDDIHSVMNHLNHMRKVSKKNDEIEFKMKQLDGTSVGRMKRVVKVQKFIGELSELQDKLIQRELAKRDQSKEEEEQINNIKQG